MITNDFQKTIRRLMRDRADKVLCRQDRTVEISRQYFYRIGNEIWAEEIKRALREAGVSFQVVSEQDHFNQWPRRSYYVVIIREAKAE